jgi:hypothetical protein
MVFRWVSVHLYGIHEFLGKEGLMTYTKYCHKIFVLLFHPSWFCQPTLNTKKISFVIVLHL